MVGVKEQLHTRGASQEVWMREMRQVGAAETRHCSDATEAATQRSVRRRAVASGAAKRGTRRWMDGWSTGRWHQQQQQMVHRAWGRVTEDGEGE